MYEYQGKIIRVIDGDTVEAEIDLGFHTFRKETLRLYGINTPELRSKDTEEKRKAYNAKARLAELSQGDLIIRTIKDKKGKYGRYLAILISPEYGDINARLVFEEYAVEADYG